MLCRPGLKAASRPEPSPSRNWGLDGPMAQASVSRGREPGLKPRLWVAEIHINCTVELPDPRTQTAAHKKNPTTKLSSHHENVTAEAC